MKISVALGFFDSVHIGHRQLLKANAEHAAHNGMTAAVHTFCNDLGEFFGSKQLYGFDERKELLTKNGAEMIIADDFDRKFMTKRGIEFLDELTSKCDIGAFFCGYDYSFGVNAECNANDLAQYASKKDIRCEILPPFTVDGKKVSTTWIKESLLAGDLDRANSLLGEPFFVRGKVVKGRGVGRAFGYPTANVSYGGFLPKQGVYKTLVSFDGKQYVAVTNVGTKPTFDESSVTIEPMLIDFSGDLYGKELTVRFIKYLRPIIKFADGNELNKQIQKDVREALC
ncbi:MAG: riboflavin biosynthesis protein RibF [Clostridia bacterium]|nr:riboflavin biosynthesis protein RibF [Clostridia bacterium]